MLSKTQKINLPLNGNLKSYIYEVFRGVSRVAGGEEFVEEFCIEIVACQKSKSTTDGCNGCPTHQNEM